MILLNIQSNGMTSLSLISKNKTKILKAFEDPARIAMLGSMTFT